MPQHGELRCSEGQVAEAVQEVTLKETGFDVLGGKTSLGYKSNGRYVPWLVRRALKQLGGEHRCRLEVVTSYNGIIEVIFSRRNLDSIPPEVFDFSSLETLRLDHNNLQVLDAHVGRLRNLKHLLLGQNQVSTLPASLANCRHIVELDVQCNRLSIVPASVWRLKRLVTLNLSWNQLVHLPPDIAKLRELRFLDLEGNNLWEKGGGEEESPRPAVPTEIVLLEHLRALNIGENGLIALPQVICRLATLRVLNLTGNKLTDLPLSFVRLEYLSELSLASNQLSCVPTCLSQLKSLRYLNLSRNLLRVLPASLALLDRLQVLLAAGNNLIAISDCLSQNLQILDISQNKLRTLCIEKLKNLAELNVSHNRLEVLPMGLGVSKGAKRLVRLSAACNRITRLNADEIMVLGRLQYLDLSGNNISLMSAELLRFMAKRLKEYCLQGNPIALSQHQSAFPMCRHVSKKGGCQKKSEKNRFCQQVAVTKTNIRRKVDQPQQTQNQQTAVEVEAEVVSANNNTGNIPQNEPIVSTTESTESNEIASMETVLTTDSKFPPPPSSVIQDEVKDELEGLLKVASPIKSLERDGEESSAEKDDESADDDKLTRIVRVGSAGGTFEFDFKGANNNKPTAPYCVEVFVPPQAVTDTSNIAVTFLYVDDVGLAQIGDEKVASHVLAFSPVVFIKASPVLTSPNRQLTTRLYEDLTLTLHLSPQTEAAIADRSGTVHVVDVLVVAGDATKDSTTRIICAPHPRARMSSTGQQVVVKFGHLGNGVAIIVSKSSNRRKACRAAEQLIRAELARILRNVASKSQVGDALYFGF